MPVVLDCWDETDEILLIEAEKSTLNGIHPHYRRHLYRHANRINAFKFIEMLLDFEEIDKNLTFKERISLYQLMGTIDE